MDQLTLGDILQLVKKLKKQGMSNQEICDLPIYLSDDDELNGIHCGWALDIVDTDAQDVENMAYLVDMINESSNNIKLESGKALLIS